MKEKILELVADLGKPLGELDSLEFLELIRDVEQLTGQRITDQQIVNINSAEELCAAVGC